MVSYITDRKKQDFQINSPRYATIIHLTLLDDIRHFIFIATQCVTWDQMNISFVSPIVLGESYRVWLPGMCIPHTSCTYFLQRGQQQIARLQKSRFPSNHFLDESRSLSTIPRGRMPSPRYFCFGLSPFAPPGGLDDLS